MAAMNRLILSLLICLLTRLALADDFNEAPIRYLDATPNNRVAKLIQRLERGDVAGEGETSLESLRNLLRELAVPESSQMLVYSKTSLQRDKISPRTPRAIYFNDDVYVGYCHDSQVVEISAVDAELGTVFYTADRSDNQFQIQRQTENCLLCHASSSTHQVPGHVVRSVYVDAVGLPVLSMGTHRIDQTSPLRERWGGWYVTGTHGNQTHLGNLIVRGQRQPEEIDNAAGQNVVTLEKRLDTDLYLSPHSDLVALMVFEHQAQGHNLIARASFDCRMALHQQEQLNEELKQPAGHLWDSTKSRIRSVSEELVQYLLFCDEAVLTAKLAGTSSFAEEFAARGPRDAGGRSLRDFDLERRMFRYPCSYLVYSEAFNALPAPVLDRVWQRLWEVVREEDKSKEFAHLSADDRRAIGAILLETKQHLPSLESRQ